MILLLGANGYVGQAFVAELRRRGLEFVGLSRREMAYDHFDRLLAYLRDRRPELVINAAGYIGKPNVDACESARAETLLGNTVLACVVAHACAAVDVPWAHVSTGCLYDGARLRQDTGWIWVKDLSRPDILARWHGHPEEFAGFTEDEEPNFSFRHPPCSFHNGTKALAEEAIRGVGRGYIWRLRIPFDEQDGPRNALSKLQRYPKVYDNINSFSHRGDFVRACLDLWLLRASWGIYNVTNPGALSARQIVELIQRLLQPKRVFEFWSGDEEFYRTGVKAPRSNCILDAGKVAAAGVRVRPVKEAMEAALQSWTPAVS